MMKRSQDESPVAVSFDSLSPCPNNARAAFRRMGFNMTLLDLLTLASYIALNVDILFQIKRIYRTRSSHDLSLTGMAIRYAAILIILIKFMSISDLPLIIGQALILLTFTTYFALALYYFATRHETRDMRELMRENGRPT